MNSIPRGESQEARKNLTQGATKQGSNYNMLNRGGRIPLRYTSQRETKERGETRILLEG